MYSPIKITQMLRICTSGHLIGIPIIMFNRFAKMFNQRQRDWCWMLIVTTVFGVLLKHISEGVAIGFFIVFIFTSGYGIGIFDMPKRKPTKHTSR
jgi:uncharacterized membrane protein YccC